MQFSKTNIVFRGDDGVDIRGKLSRLTRHSAIFEVPNPLTGLRVSGVLPGFSITAGERKVYAGRAVVRSLIHTGNSLIGEAELEHGGFSTGAAFPDAQAGRWTERFQGFVQGWQREYRVRSAFKNVVADMQSFFEALRLWTDGLEMELQNQPETHRKAFEHALIDELSKPVVAAIDSFIDGFESLARDLPADEVDVHRHHLRRQLHPLLLTSPFAYRTYTKPLGYAGDYEVVDMMLRPPYEGETLFAKLINVWLVGQAPAEAHRNRVSYLVRKLVEETTRASSPTRRARVFNLGCGPADEVRRFLTEEATSDRAALTLLDFNEETITQLQGNLDRVKTRYRPGAEYHLVRKSVQQVLKDSTRSAKKGEAPAYDLVYCAGLFDYLTDPVCKRLMDIFYDMLAPGGLLVATNVSDAMNPTRPFRYSMEYILDWHLIYRDGTDFRKVAPELAPPDAVKVISDVTGVNVFIEVRKPNNG
jgi:extracellular factor (EF) 3-hydroxypalmitic acid methyl ester biosynthesis protein